MADELIFEDPPEAVLIRAQNQGARYVDFAVSLREHKDKWAVLPNKSGSDKAAQNLAQSIRRGATKAFAPKNSYEAVSEGTKIWVRYVGAPEDPHEPAGARDSSAGDDGDDDEPPKSFAPLIREWARDQGIDVPAAGRLPRALIDQYFDAHPEEERPKHLVRVV